MKMLRNLVMVGVLLGASMAPSQLVYACFYAGTIGFSPWEDMDCEETCETQEWDELEDDCTEACEQHCGTGWSGDLDACYEIEPGSCGVGCGCMEPI